MTDLRKAAEMAVEVLNGFGCAVEFGTEGLAKHYQPKVPQTILALRKALADPNEKPVGWMYVNKDGECEQIEYGPIPFWDESITLLYTTPPKREWVGLTDQEIKDLWNQHEPQFDYYSFSCDIEAKLKEKNT